MLSDILQKPNKAVVDGKEYLFEFDHAGLASFESRVRKSIYEVYENIILKKSLMSSECVAMTVCAMLKHHSKEEIFDFEEKLNQYPGLWLEIKEDVITAFVLPLLPPKMLSKFQSAVKKKHRSTTKKKTPKS